MFRVADLGVKELLLADDRAVFFTTSHFDGYPAVLVRIPDLARLDRDELQDMIGEAWLTESAKAHREGLARRARDARRLSVSRVAGVRRAGRAASRSP